MKLKTLFLWLIVLLPVEGMADALSLMDAYHKTLLYDATIAASRAENSAEKEEIGKAKAGFLPQIRLSLYNGRASTDSETPGSFGGMVSLNRSYESQNYTLSLRQPIFNKASFAQYAQAKAGVAKSEAMLNKADIALMVRLGGAYFDALLALENIQYSQAQKLSVQSQLHQADKRLKAGAGTITEVNEAQSNLEDVLAKSLEWVNSLEYAKQMLQNLTGVYPEQLLVLDPAKLQLSMPQPNNIEAWMASALEKNPDILAARQYVQMMSQEVEKSNAGHYPTLDLVASRAETKSDNNFTIGSSYQTDSIGLQLNVPIYSGGYVSASARQSVAKLNQASEKVVEQERLVTADVRKYFNAVQNGVAMIHSYEQSVKSNEIAVIGTKKGYEAGIRTNVEVLNAQEKLFAAKRELARERYQYLFHRLQLKQAAGLLTDADIQETSVLLSLAL